MRLLITGSNGLLGQELVAYCLKDNIDFIAVSKGKNRNPDCPDEKYMELDITDEKEVHNVVIQVRPTHISHTAALTNVDYCEINPEECNLVNVQATEFLIDAAIHTGAHFQLLSTDFVFDGNKGNYKEEDEPNPLSTYAQSKVDAEKLVFDKCKTQWSVVRTIIVYGTGHNLSRTNLVVWAKETLESDKEMNIVDDQFRAPTYAPDLAKACMNILLKNKTGIFHICGPETLSIYTIVERIANHYGYRTELIKKISSSTLSQPAKRPPKTGFDLSKAKHEIGYDPMTLEESLDEIFN